MNALLERVYGGESLSADQARSLFATVMAGECEPLDLAALLVALKMKGESSAEIAGAAAAMRDAAAPFPRPDYPFADTAGTGGDGAGTLNVSTAAALVLAECGLPVAKHGNRAVSSRSGSADVLEALGLRLEVPAETARRMLDETGFCFLFAPQYHPGVRHAMPVRTRLATRTLFNLLGPLVHPAEPPVQLMGVYDAELCGTLAETLRRLGCTTALVVNGGIDEVALHRETHAVLLRDDGISRHTITPEDAGLARRPLTDLAGGDPGENAARTRALLAGEPDPAFADAVSINAGALLWAAGRVDTLREGVHDARAALATGSCLKRLERAVEIGRA